MPIYQSFLIIDFISQLSQQAVKDYNRGRLYLADLARRENVPIYESISDAVEAAINKCIK